MPQQLGADVGEVLNRAGIAYALTGAHVAGREAPFITAVPVVDGWVRTDPRRGKEQADRLREEVMGL